MNRIVAVTKQLRLIAVLALLISVGAAQASQLPKVNVKCVDNAVGPGIIAVYFDSIPGAVSYQVLIKGPGEWAFDNKGGWHTASWNNAHQFTGLTPGEIYTIRVRALDAEGNRGIKSRIIYFTTAPEWVWERFFETRSKTGKGQKWDEQPNMNYKACRGG